ncbi:hypothetical protein CO670_02500 [Rhizobium sp. J15]|uniref:class I SAM-dependent methyltransferase n=1 Tax=Rhizobium sp. J15 TaxID=2035450 RepID=UPI000BE87417|nr:methyltransferase domain-containing protein [Rhizobium sp. J15]PDT18296.1 hypothetical protein CO670_02500 [Rhizobium sp. J15]
MNALNKSPLRGAAAALLRDIATRLRKGVTVPLTGVNISVNVARLQSGGIVSQAAITTEACDKQKTLDDVALRILRGHIRAVLEKCPELKRFYHPLLESNLEKTNAFLDFLNDTLVVFENNARGVHVRRQLAKLREKIGEDDVAQIVNQQIAISDLDDGVIERALILIDDRQYGEKVASDVQAFDDSYEASPPFLAFTRSNLNFQGDVRGNSLVWFLRQNPGIIAGKRILHIAPEDVVSHYILEHQQELNCTYETLDGFSSTVDYAQDITNLQFSTGMFDLIICHRVLEHVVDDLSAMASMFRILSPGGVLDISVPQSMNLATTNEWIAQDSTHHDHVRQYGRDFAFRLCSVGFEVSVERGLLERDLTDHRSDGTYPMRHYICRKPIDSVDTAKGGAFAL